MSTGEVIGSGLFERVLLDPVRRGASELFVVSGYASASMVTRHFELVATELSKEISIDLHIGMTGLDGLSKDTLLALQAIPRQIGGKTFNCTMNTKGFSNHSKVFVWCDDEGPVEAYLGSSNYTQLGFGLSKRAKNHIETCTPVNPVTAFDFVMASARGGIGYKSADLAQHVDLYDEPEFRNLANQDPDFEKPAFAYVDLPLVTLRRSSYGQIHEKSGLNWGQRDGRDPDQAYIPVPSNIANSGFFPPQGVHFQVVTDDGEAFICTTAQGNAKAIETPNDNSILGKYFRTRLNLASGAFVTTEDLERFGTKVVRLSKVSDDSYILSFQPGRPLF